MLEKTIGDRLRHLIILDLNPGWCRQGSQAEDNSNKTDRQANDREFMKVAHDLLENV